MVHGATVRRPDSILTAVALADAILLVLLAGEVETQETYHLTSLLIQSVLAYEWQDSQLDLC